MNYIYNNGELYHWGIKGMKWGVRRYQNTDGSLTDAGKKRYDRDVRENNAKKKDNRIEIPESGDPNRWVREDISRSKKAVDETASLVKQGKALNDAIGVKRVKMDLSKMSDQELRNQINRATLEQQYTNMFAPQKISKGRIVAGKILNGAGTALAIGSSALGIALAIKELTSD